MPLTIKPASEVAYDCISMGEVMLRLDPGEGRIHTARQFAAWEGGGEYNVARGLRRCFGMKTAIVTAFADNDVGRLVEDFILQGGVDTDFIKWVKYDGIGRSVRNGLNFTERGFGIRGGGSSVRYRQSRTRTAARFAMAVSRRCADASDDGCRKSHVLCIPIHTACDCCTAP